MQITSEAFDTLCKLARLRPSSTATIAARRVLVLGESGSAVARDMGVHTGTVHNAVTHARAMARLALAVAAGSTDSKPRKATEPQNPDHPTTPQK